MATGPAPAPRVAVAVGRVISSDGVAVGGFTPGTVIADRYRIIGLLGRGGMGEVYRADDLKLGQPVALKFLPDDLAGDPVRRERFYAEVRIARQISHPNICRVYDIAEFGGRQFLSMEFVDGEDLASLLKRIGHLPGPKAVEIARQLCAGLAAAHDKGVLHRDLKPANVMLDGHGRVRITDFGLAIAIEHAREEWFIQGTPAYMAPEQLAGEPASVRSDIYALGLVLYELYTGKRAFSASTLADLRLQKEHETPTAPSEISRDIDPVIERLIQRCIEKDARNRPGSVLQVAAALPGGDPLAAALAAGETPSPEMVAAASTGEGLRPAVAWALLGLAALSIVGNVVLGEQLFLFRRPLAGAPPVLVERAREVARMAGDAAPPVDSASGVAANADYLRYVRDHDARPDRASTLGPDAILFWYRQGPRALTRMTGLDTGVGYNNPPMIDAGELRIMLNSRGELRELTAIPSPGPRGPQRAEVDWAGLFKSAGLDYAAWQPAAPASIPDFYADTRLAWTGPPAAPPALPTRIDAASYAGRAVEFVVVSPWTRHSRVPPAPLRRVEMLSNLLAALLVTTFVGGGAFFARRNLRLGRGDRRGATRLAIFTFALMMVDWLAGEHHVAQFREAYLLVSRVGFAMFLAAMLWVMYVALEPFVRRNSPTLLVSWSRLLAGRLDDPLVGRDILIGCAAGVAGSIAALAFLLPGWTGHMEEMPRFTEAVVDVPGVVAAIATTTINALLLAFGQFFLLFVARLILRRVLPAACAVALIISLLNVAGTANPAYVFPILLVAIGVIVLTLARAGLLAGVIALFNVVIVEASPSLLPLGSWQSGLGAAMLAVPAALAVYGFYRSLGGRPAFGTLAVDA